MHNIIWVGVWVCMLKICLLFIWLLNCILQHADMLQPIDQRLVVQIKQLVRDGVTSIGEVKRNLKRYVERELFTTKLTPAVTKTRYYPRTKDILNHIQIALAETL